MSQQGDTGEGTSDENNASVATTIVARGERGGAETGPEATMAPGSITFAPAFAGEPVKKKALDHGLVIEDFVEGDGDELLAGRIATVHYTGYLTKGTTFDSSVTRGTPASFVIGKGKVIKAWDQGMLGMKVGGKRRLLVPSALGYGPRTAGKIPPNSDLVFTVELLAVSKEPSGPEGFEGRGRKTEKRDNGLVIVTYAEGEGEAAASGDKVFVHYTGTLKDGTQFDSSLARGEAISMPLGRGVKGWNQGIEGMKPGGRRKLKIPAALGYGERKMGDKIPENSDLVFTVELMALNKR